MSTPTTITREQLRAAYDALGLVPAAYNATASIHITPTEVTVTRHACGTNGRMYLDETGEVATVVTVVRVGRGDAEGATDA